MLMSGCGAASCMYVSHRKPIGFNGVEIVRVLKCSRPFYALRGLPAVSGPCQDSP